MDIIAQLKQMGFSDSYEPAPRRLIVAIAGPEKTAKTHFGLTGPAPVFLINMDNGTEGVVEKFQESGKEIYVYTVRVPRGKVQADYQNMWFGVKTAILKCCESGEGTIVLDTASELYELSRLSHFGKLEQVQPFHYSQVNAEWQKEVLSAIYDSKINAVMIHRIKPKWVNNARTSDYEVAGFSDTGYKVQVKLASFRESFEDDDGNTHVRFGLDIEDCRPNAGVIGKRYVGVLPVVPSTRLQIDPVLNFEFLLNQVHGSGK